MGTIEVRIMAKDVMQSLREAVEGLTYPSESDEPFEVFQWGPAKGAARDQVAAHGGNGRKIVEVPVETFFKQLDEADEAARYRRLQQVLQSNLKDLHIFRMGDGEVRVDVYLIGQLRSGEWAGLHTVSVET
jgi:hypothetical protein